MQTLLEQVQEQQSPETGKKCPFCAEVIQFEAIKCRYCGEFLNKARRDNSKWYHSTGVLVLAILTLGPLALPLVWSNRRYNMVIKVAISIAVIVLTVGLCYAMGAMLKIFMDQFKALGI